MLCRPFGLASFSLLAFLLGCGPEAADPPRARPVVQPDASDRFFAGEILHLELTLKPKDAEKINREERPWVSCTLVEKNAAGEKVAEYKEVAVKLKGAAGSFQGFGDKPALTLRMDKHLPRQLFHDLAKFHLNNSVQDDTYLHEQISAELMHEAGVPAARVTHARVWLNGRDVGLYVVKEGFDRRFLARHFARPEGNLYDGGFCTDIDSELEKDGGQGPNDRSDLAALKAACEVSDPALRAARLESLVDIDALLSFVAMELMTCHWDGYARNRNNYRLYFDPATGKAHFFPHGMDQMFGDPGFSIVEYPAGTVANAVMQNPAWREKFQRRVTELLPLFSPPTKLLARIDALHARLRPTLAAIDPNMAHEHAERVRELKERITARAQNLEEQKSFPAPKPVEFDENGVLQLADWRPAAEVDDAALEEVELSPEQHALRIACGPGGRCIASWRKHLLLPRGQYRFACRVQTKDLRPITDEKGAGAGLRISGENRKNGLAAAADWTELAFEFRIADESRDIELVAELRALAGEALFETESLRLIKVPVLQ